MRERESGREGRAREGDRGRKGRGGEREEVETGARREGEGDIARAVQPRSKNDAGEKESNRERR